MADLMRILGAPVDLVLIEEAPECLTERIRAEGEPLWIDGDLPKGADWHQALLHIMGLEIEGVRPSVLSPESVAVLRELLSFRRFFRHSYASDLDAGPLDILTCRLMAAAPRILTEIEALDRFLGAVAAAKEWTAK
jgi:hypothetical protein